MVLKIEKSNLSKNDLIEMLRKDLPVLRARIGLSQEILADRIGISRQTYGAIENGKREMTWTTFLALVALFKSNEQTALMLSQKGDLLIGIDQILNTQPEEDK